MSYSFQLNDKVPQILIGLIPRVIIDTRLNLFVNFWCSIDLRLILRNRVKSIYKKIRHLNPDCLMSNNSRESSERANGSLMALILHILSKKSWHFYKDHHFPWHCHSGNCLEINDNLRKKLYALLFLRMLLCNEHCASSPTTFSTLKTQRKQSVPKRSGMHRFYIKKVTPHCGKFHT